MARQSKIAAGKRLRAAVIRTVILVMAILLNGTAQEVSGAADKNVRRNMLVTTQWLAQHLNDPGVVVLCVSASPGFYSEGHIPGARWLNLADIVTKRSDSMNALPDAQQLAKTFRTAGVDGNSRIVLYGDHYNLLAARAYFTLDYLGLADHAGLLDGGLAKWKNEARPLTTVETVPAESSMNGFKPQPRSRMMVETDEMKRLAENGKTNAPLLLDARPLEEYTGERHSADVHKLGHLPGAQHLYWQDLLVSREDPVLLPPEGLREKFETAGAKPGKEIITYCRTGMQSSFDYFAAKYLGYDVRMYGASFYEWSAEDLPAEKSK